MSKIHKCPRLVAKRTSCPFGKTHPDVAKVIGYDGNRFFHNLTSGILTAFTVQPCYYFDVLSCNNKNWLTLISVSDEFINYPVM